MSNRKSRLEHELNNILRDLKAGAPSYRITNRYIVQKLPYDLMQINRLTPTLSGLKQETIVELVRYWQHMGNTASTIARKIAVLRKIVEHRNTHEFPTNSELRITTPPQPKRVAVIDIPITVFGNPAVRQLCELQYYFGLKKFEAIMLRVSIVNQKLYIPRSMAYNNKDRFVAIVTSAQRRCLDQQAALSSQFINDVKTRRALASWHQLELAQWGINDPDHYRYDYIKQRYQQLTQENSVTQIIMTQLRQELGYQSNQPLMRILKCLDVF